MRWLRQTAYPRTRRVYCRRCEVLVPGPDILSSRTWCRGCERWIVFPYKRPPPPPPPTEAELEAARQRGGWWKR